MMQFAGYFGYFGFSLDHNHNKKVEEANKLVDEYNQTVGTIEGKDNQIAYQFEMKNRMYKILQYRETINEKKIK